MSGEEPEEAGRIASVEENRRTQSRNELVFKSVSFHWLSRIST